MIADMNDNTKRLILTTSKNDLTIMVANLLDIMAHNLDCEECPFQDNCEEVEGNVDFVQCKEHFIKNMGSEIKEVHKVLEERKRRNKD